MSSIVASSRSSARPSRGGAALVCALLLALLAMPALAGKGAAVAVGQVLLATGEAWRVQGEQREPLQRGHAIREGDTLLTGDGQLIVRMEDQALLSLRQGSRLIIENYRNTADLERAVVRLRLEEGTLRSASGSVGKPRFRLNTPFSALGIRGTDFVTRVADGRQEVHVQSGAVAVAFLDAAGCSAASLGECVGVATVLAAGTGQTLALDAATRSSSLRDGISEILLPAAAERELFVTVVSVDRPGMGDRSAELAPRRLPATDGRVFDANGRAIEPFAVSEQRIVSNSVDASVLREKPPAEFLGPGVAGAPGVAALPSASDDDAVTARFLDGFLFSRGTTDLDGDGVDDIRELVAGTLPWRSDSDGDGIRDGIDTDPRVREHLPVTDGGRALTSTSALRRGLANVDASALSFSFGAFGVAGFYQIRFPDPAGSLSLWLDPERGQLWGVTPVLQTYLDARQLPEGRNIWSSMAAQFQGLASRSDGWLQRLAAQQVDLWHLPLANQTLVFEPDAAASLGRGLYVIEFNQFLAQGAAVPDMNRPFFRSIVDGSGRFDITYIEAGKDFTLSGVSSANGLLTAADQRMEVRGRRAADASVLLLVRHLQSGSEYVLGLSPAGIAVDPAPATLQTQAADAVEWGRWSDFAQLSAADVQRLLGAAAPGERNIVQGRYALQAPAATDLPARGAFEFAMGSHEAIYSDAGGLRPASLSNGYMQVDFDRQRFVAAFDATAPGVELTHVRGAGTLEAAGRLVSQADFSNARMEGALGPGGASASLLFERPVGADAQFAGITHWAR